MNTLKWSWRHRCSKNVLRPPQLLGVSQAISPPLHCLLPFPVAPFSFLFFLSSLVRKIWCKTRLERWASWTTLPISLCFLFYFVSFALFIPPETKKNFVYIAGKIPQAVKWYLDLDVWCRDEKENSKLILDLPFKWTFSPLVPWKNQKPDFKEKDYVNHFLWLCGIIWNGSIRNETGMNYFLLFIRALKNLFIKIIHGLCLRFGRVNTEMSVLSQMIYKVNTTPIISLSSFFL